MYSDPIADMLTRIRNAYRAHKTELSMPHSQIKQHILGVMKDHDYISDFKVEKEANKSTLQIKLNYLNNKPALTSIKRISKTGKRIYQGKDNLPYVLSGLGIAIISTSKGLMTANQARKQSLGGEIICEIW